MTRRLSGCRMCHTTVFVIVEHRNRSAWLRRTDAVALALPKWKLSLVEVRSQVNFVERNTAAMQKHLTTHAAAVSNSVVKLNCVVPFIRAIQFEVSPFMIRVVRATDACRAWWFWIGRFFPATASSRFA